MVALASIQVYRREIYQSERLTLEQEGKFINRARLGDKTAKEAILLGCLRYVLFIAQYYRKFLRHDDCSDLVGIGNLAMTECFNRALTKENPIGYLQGCAKRSIMVYCYQHRDEQIWELLDSDALLAYPIFQPEQPDMSWLYTAVEQLPPKQRVVITRHFGLYGQRSESLNEISKSLSPNPHGSMAYPLFYRAIRNLQTILATLDTSKENNPTS